uniref:Importin subunit alpha n=1 Tax=Brassica campestris TaxID=3711 RepID=M4FE95_BRACM
MKGGGTTSWTTTSVRRSGYKAVVDGVGGRRRREEDMVEIRKAKREESLLKKRREALPLPHSPPPSAAVSLDQNLISRIWSDKKELLIEATTQIRTLLCGEMFNVHVEEVIQAGLVPRFVEFLTWDDFPQLQFEAAWALTNIASGTSENTEVVIDHGAVAILVRLLSSPYDGVREQVVWALGNISGDSPRCRNIVLGHGALPSLLLQLNNGAKLSMLVNAAWTLSNLCRGKPQPPYDQVSAALPALAQLIRLDDKELLAYTCWALVYLSDGSNEKIQAVIEANVCGRLIGLSVHRSPSVATPALRTIGIVVTGNDSQTQYIIDLQALPCLLNLLRGPYNKTIRKEACWVVSNITAGCQSQIQAVYDADVCPALVNLLRNSEFDVKYEAAWAICNAIAGGSYKQILHADGNQCTETNVNPHAQLIEDAEGLEKIESLQSHENSDIYEMAVKILETYWLEEEEEDEVEEEDKGRQDIVYFPVDNFANMPTPSCTLGEMYCGP